MSFVGSLFLFAILTRFNYADLAGSSWGNNKLELPYNTIQIKGQQFSSSAYPSPSTILTMSPCYLTFYIKVLVIPNVINLHYQRFLHYIESFWKSSISKIELQYWRSCWECFLAAHVVLQRLTLGAALVTSLLTLPTSSDIWYYIVYILPDIASDIWYDIVYIVPDIVPYIGTYQILYCILYYMILGMSPGMISGMIWVGKYCLHCWDCSPELPHGCLCHLVVGLV